MSQQPKIMIERYLDGLFSDTGNEDSSADDKPLVNNEPLADNKPLAEDKLSATDSKPSTAVKPPEIKAPEIKAPEVKAPEVQTKPLDNNTKPLERKTTAVSTPPPSSLQKPPIRTPPSAGTQLTVKPATPMAEPLVVKTRRAPAKPVDDPSSPESVYQEQKQRLERLLEQASKVQTQEAVTADLDAASQEIAETATQVMLDTDSSTESSQAIEALEDSQWLENGLPAWAQGKFDILLLDVSGLSLAVPLVALGQIHTLDDEITPLFGQSDWFMGIQTTPQGKIRIVNTANFVMPERYQEHFVKEYKYAISINGLPWAIAVNSIGQPISVETDDVRWRSERTNRPWLAGTIKQHMCALLDIPTMGRLLQEKDTNRR